MNVVNTQLPQLSSFLFTDVAYDTLCCVVSTDSYAILDCAIISGDVV